MKKIVSITNGAHDWAVKVLNAHIAEQQIEGGEDINELVNSMAVDFAFDATYYTLEGGRDIPYNLNYGLATTLKRELDVNLKAWLDEEDDTERDEEVVECFKNWVLATFGTYNICYNFDTQLSEMRYCEKSED